MAIDNGIAITLAILPVVLFERLLLSRHDNEHKGLDFIAQKILKYAI